MRIRLHQLPITGRAAVDLVKHALPEGFALRKLADPLDDQIDDIDLELAESVLAADPALVVLCAEMSLSGSEAATWVGIGVDYTRAGLWVRVQEAGQPTPQAPIVIACDCPPAGTDPMQWDAFGEDGDRFAATAEAALLPYLQTMLAAIAE